MEICASSSYVSFTVRTDTRLKAASTVSGADSSRVVSEGLKMQRTITGVQFMKQLAQANVL
jgi:hypothetical protein